MTQTKCVRFLDLDACITDVSKTASTIDSRKLYHKIYEGNCALSLCKLVKLQML